MKIPAEYIAILEAHGRPGFAPSEIVQLSGAAASRKGMPPRRLWDRIAPTLIVANDLRRRMIAHGATGLLVRAAYRPSGGASNSAHKSNAALDLDLIPGDVARIKLLGVDLRSLYAEEAVRLWCESGAVLRIGLGLYGPAGRDWTWRVHIDTTRCRSWQHAGSRIVRPPSTVTIAKRLGLRLPTDTETEDDDT
jgi:hypothetical protein